MRETSYHAVIAEMTVRALWELQNLLDCIPDALWDRCYGGAPLWQHVYIKRDWPGVVMYCSSTCTKVSDSPQAIC